MVTKTHYVFGGQCWKIAVKWDSNTNKPNKTSLDASFQFFIKGKYLIKGKG